MPTKSPTAYDLTLEQLEVHVASLGHKPYRARQLWQALYRRLAPTPMDVHEVPEDLRLKLTETLSPVVFEPVRQAASADGAAIKVLAKLAGGALIESVLMRYPAKAPETAPSRRLDTPEGKGDKKGRSTVCVSTQVGCAVGCPFCATGEMGFIRNLTPGEIVAQVLHFARMEPIDNVVFMGMGEPMLNYANTWQAIETLNSPQGYGLGARRFTVSTSGILPGIRRLAGEKLLVNLAVSLHAPNDELRGRLVPINAKYPIAALMQACDDYVERTGRRVSYEYVLLSGVNDSEELAHQLGALLRGRLAHVNLIPVNPTPGSFHRPTAASTYRFQTIVHDYGIVTTVRAEKGVEISAACGQLATPAAPLSQSA